MSTEHERSETDTATSPNDVEAPSVAGTLLENLVGYALRRAQLTDYQRFNAATADHRIRPAQFSVMIMAEAYPGITQSQLAKTLEVDPPRMVNLIHDLEDRDLAVRVRCKTDRRSHGIFLTKKGETTLRELKEQVQRADRQHAASLSEPERATLLRLLRRLY